MLNEEVVEELINDVIFWEKHTEIYTSLETILSRKYIIEEKDVTNPKRSGVKRLIDEIVSARMDLAEYPTLVKPLSEKFTVNKIRDEIEYI